MMRTLLVFFLLATASAAVAQTSPPFIVGEWAGNCDADFRIGYRLEPNGQIMAYTVNKEVKADLAAPRILSENADFFTLDFSDGASPVVWRKVGQTIQPWSQGPGGGTIIKNGVRDNGNPTPVFQRCK